MSFSVSLKQNSGRLLRPKIAFQRRACPGCRFEDLSLKFFGVPLPVPLRFDASALGGTLPDELETGREYEMSCDFRDANVRLPLAGETPCCVNLRPVPSKASPWSFSVLRHLDCRVADALCLCCARPKSFGASAR